MLAKNSISGKTSKNEGKINPFCDKQKLREFVISRPSRNSKGNPSGWNENMVDSNLRPHKTKIKNTVKGTTRLI